MEQMVVLYRSYASALAARKVYADAVCGRGDGATIPWLAEARKRGFGTLGCDVTTPAAFLADEWELWGDGRTIVSDLQRRLIVAQLLGEQGRFSSSLASSRLFARFIGYHAGGALFEELVSGDDGTGAPCSVLDGAESAVFSLVRAYYERLDAEGLVEAGRAAASLAPSCAARRIIVAERLDAAPAMRALIDAADVSYAEGEARTIRADRAQRSLFAFPAGVGAIKDTVLALVGERMRDDAAIVVASLDPRALFAACAPALQQLGREAGLECSVELRQTGLGRALSAAWALHEGSGHSVQAATDFAYGPFSGMTFGDAQRLNTHLRRDRCCGAEGTRALLREASTTFSAIEGLVSNETGSDADVRSLLMGALDAASGMTAADRAVEAKALDAYLDLRARACEQGMDARMIMDQAQGLSVSVSFASSGYDPQTPSVRFIGSDGLGRLAPGSFDGVIAEGLTDALVNGSSARSTLDALAQRLGLPAYPSRTERSRSDFETARRAAVHSFACAMPLRDDAFEPTYPAFTLDEYVSAWAEAEGASAADRDESFFGFPRRLVEEALRLGEDDPVSCVGQCGGDVMAIEELAGVTRGDLKHLSLMDHLKTVDEGGERLPVLSPSAIEAYLLCPYLWFATNRLRLSEIDETFSAREMGLFAHGAYAALYGALAAEGIRRIEPCNLDRAHELLDQVMDRLLEEHGAARALPQEGGCMPERLVATTPQEVLEIRALREALHESLGLFAQLPDRYEVVAHEVPIRPEDGVDFAGARLNGRIDRVDVAKEGGRFAILDYKGTVAHHEAGFTEKDDEGSFALPSKVQALIYAVGFQRLHEGLAAAAALYACYRAKEPDGFLAGSFDPVAYDASGLARPASAVQRDFASFLALLEERIAPSIEALKGGAIAPDPKSADACTYCPLRDCERRC